jgi:hypothetical protein
LTPKRRRRVENDGYSSFVRRILRVYRRRVGDGDVEALALMLGLADEIDTAIAEAAKGLRDRGYSWAEISSRLGITRQATQQRWGTPWSQTLRLTVACGQSRRSAASLDLGCFIAVAAARIGGGRVSVPGT